MEIDFVKKHLRKLGFDLNIDDYYMVKKIIEDLAQKDDINSIEHYMKQLQNCGGYALQIPICIFSMNDTYTFEENVLRIQELYPFVRLLGDTKLNENEYIVIFRAGKTGHHFVKLDEKGNLLDKCEANLPGKFTGWHSLSNDEEAIFAVTKQEFRSNMIKTLPQCNRDMFLDEEAYYEKEEDGYIGIRKESAKRPETFEIKLQEAYNKRLQSFSYNNKTYNFKIDKNDPSIIYICDDSQIYGQFYTDGKEFDIELDNKKKNDIFGFKPSKDLKIYEEKEID